MRKRRAGYTDTSSLSCCSGRVGSQEGLCFLEPHPHDDTGKRVHNQGRWPRRLRERDKLDAGRDMILVETLGSFVFRIALPIVCLPGFGIRGVCGICHVMLLAWGVGLGRIWCLKILDGPDLFSILSAFAKVQPTVDNLGVL